MTESTHLYDDVSIESLVDKGSCKWSTYPGAIGAWTAEMDFGVAPAIRDTLTTLNDRDLYGYAPPALTRDMAAATSAFYSSRYGWDVNPDWVSAASDVLTAMSATLTFYTEPGHKLVIPTPAYMPFLTLPPIYGREFVEVPMERTADSWRMDYEAIDRALTTAGPGGTPGGLLVLCNPHNPIGRVYTREELTTLAEVVHRHGARVFSDEIHAPLTFPGHTHVPYASVSAEAAAHTITATSHSKSFNTPGLKCAQIIFSNEADSRKWKTAGQFVAKSASNPGLLAAVAAYRNSADWLADTLQYLDGNRAAMTQLVAHHLPKARYLAPEGTYLAWLDLTAYDLPGRHASDRPANLQQFFIDNAQVALIDGKQCGSDYAGYVRVNMGTPRHILQQIVTRMGQAVAQVKA